MLKKSEDWKGIRFLFLSLLVTAISIIFFFAGQRLFPKIKEGISQLKQEVVEWGGFKFHSVELQILGNLETHTEFEKEFEPFIKQLRKKLSRLEGRLWWEVHLSAMKQELLQAGWIETVALQRSLPSRLKVIVTARTPSFMLRALHYWIAVDARGKAILRSASIPGSWSTLPLVFGWEEEFRSGDSLEEINRQLQSDRSLFQDLHELLFTLKERVHLSIESVVIQKNSWTEKTLFTVSWTAQAGEQKNRITFLENQWKHRLEGLQFVLSDVMKHHLEEVQILGQFEKRWIVQKGEKGNLRSRSNE